MRDIQNTVLIYLSFHLFLKNWNHIVPEQIYIRITRFVT